MDVDTPVHAIGLRAAQQNQATLNRDFHTPAKDRLDRQTRATHDNTTSDARHEAAQLGRAAGTTLARVLACKDLAYAATDGYENLADS